MKKKISTGEVLEEMILPTLQRGGYEYEKKQNIGIRPTGRKHIVDVIATKDGKKILISLKWQQVRGTAEQKVPFEFISLLYALETSQQFNAAYLVLGGDGWKLREFYVDGGLDKYIIRKDDRVKIIAFETFVGLANTGSL